MENHSLMPITRNMIHQRLALNDVLDIIVTTHLPACKHTVGLDNPGRSEERRVGKECRL